MDGDWNEVKAKPKKHRKPKQEDDDAYSYGGGFGQGGMLKAGAVKNVLTLGGPKHVAQHSASVVADADYLRDEDEEIKYEIVSHECAIAVQNARLAKDWSQAELAKKVNEKPSKIIDLENGTAKYNADLVNRIERVLGVKIPRNRNKKK
jgi:DNA-binding XRE family transcriptional regulator